MKLKLMKALVAFSLVLGLALGMFGCADYVSVENMELNQTKVTLTAGETFQIELTFTPTEATIDEATYESSDTAVATVDRNGLVTAVADGVCTIKVVSKSNRIERELFVRVGLGWDGTPAGEEELAAITDESTKTVSVSSAGQLAAIAKNVNSGNNSYEGYTVILLNDIDLNDQPWTPIGNAANDAGNYEGATGIFKGSVNGGGNTIYNLNIQDKNAANNLGFFGIISLPKEASISDIVFQNATVSGNGSCVGVLAGAAAAAGEWIGGVGYGPASISGIEVHNAVVSGSKYVGGVIGYATTSLTKSTVTGTSVSSIVSASIPDSGENAGAIVGNLYDLFYIEAATVTDCQVSGLAKLGGVAGSAHNAYGISNSTVSGVTMMISADSTDDRFGWISGRAAKVNEANYSENRIENCSAVKGSESVEVQTVRYV